MSNRDFKMKKRTRTQHYRGRKDSTLAQYYLCCIGEAMTPVDLLRESDEAEVLRDLSAGRVPQAWKP